MSTKSGDFGDISDDSRSNSPIHSLKVTIRKLLGERKNTTFCTEKCETEKNNTVIENSYLYSDSLCICIMLDVFLLDARTDDR